MDCAEAKLQIEPYVTGEIPPDARSALEEHLGACAECRLDVELTRASRNTPPEPAPETPPALVEPIDPGGAESAGTPAESRAAGEASSAPAPTTGPGGESWTLDSIFGSGGATKGSAVPPVFESSGATPEPPAAETSVSPKKSLGLDVKPAAGAPVPPAPPAEPEPPSRPVSTPVFATSADEALPPLLTPAPPKKRDEPPASDAPSWDFEPAEASGKAKPPEGSLFFAKEALSRGTPPKKGSPAARLALWAGGGVLGVGLLAASVWIALTMHPPCTARSTCRR
jgi:putative zinc finger protein